MDDDVVKTRLSESEAEAEAEESMIELESSIVVGLFFNFCCRLLVSQDHKQRNLHFASDCIG